MTLSETCLTIAVIDDDEWSRAMQETNKLHDAR